MPYDSEGNYASKEDLPLWVKVGGLLLILLVALLLGWFKPSHNPCGGGWVIDAETQSQCAQELGR